MRNSPGFAVVAIATIALAIGANSAMFSFVNGVFLRPLPYPEPDRVVRVLERLPTGGATGISTLNYLDWQTQNTVFEHIAAEVAWRATLTGGEEAIAIRGARVSAAYFDIFGAKAALGRTFLPGEDSIGNDRVVLLSHVLWENRFGSDPTIVGQPIALDGDAHTVVGILEEGAFDRAAAQVYKPLAFQPSNMTRGFRWLGATAKLKPGVTLERARAEMAVISQRLAAAYPDSNREWGTAVDRLADVVVDAPLRTAVAVLFGATALVLLIGCANLASLALARGISRQREMAVRAALGANRWRLVALVLTETAVIALCGGIAGAVVGYGVLQWILSLIPPYALPPALDVRMDSSALLFALIAAVVTALLFGLTPAVQSASTPLVDALKEGGPSTSTSGRSRRAHSRLVILEIALAVVL